MANTFLPPRTSDRREEEKWQHQLSKRLNDLELAIETTNWNLITAVVPNSTLSPTSAGLYLGSNKMGYWDSTANDWTAYVADDGSAYFANATITGTITASSGTIGGWTINENSLSSSVMSFDSNQHQITVGDGSEIVISATSENISVGGTVVLDGTNQKITVGDSSEIVIDGANEKIESSNYVSGYAGSGFHLSSNLLEVGNIACRGLFRTAVFQKDVISAVGGTVLVSHDADVLSADMSSSDDAAMTIEGNVTFAVNDLLRIKDGTDDEWFQVTNAASAPTYVVTRDKDAQYGADANPQWKKGATVANYGQSGDGGIYMTASEDNAPYISVYTHAGAPWDTITTRLRVGNLNGFLGYSSDLYGIAIGDSTNYLKYDPTGKLQICADGSNAITIKNGSDILLEAADSGASSIIFQDSGGGSNHLSLYRKAADDNFFIAPDITQTCILSLGSVTYKLSEIDMAAFTGISMHVSSTAEANSGTISIADDTITIQAQYSSYASQAAMVFYSSDSSIMVTADTFFPSSSQAYDLGSASYYWDDIYYVTAHQPADFYFLDSKDDVGILREIKGSGVIDERTGLELIDDSTLQDWMLSKNKKTGKTMYASENRPFISNKIWISLLAGAIRQIDKRLGALENNAS